MKNIAIACFLLLSGITFAGEYKPFVMVDASSEKDSLSSEYINANITMGVKTPDKIEYSAKVGTSAKNAYNNADQISNNLELKVKKSFDIGMFFIPYTAVRLGNKIESNASNFLHYSVDLGTNVPLSNSFALDIGYRYRNAFESSQDYRSNRYHATLLYAVDQQNTIGLRYASSYAHKTTEDRDSWRVHYQRNF